MPIDHPAAARLKAQFPALAFQAAEFRGQAQIVIPREHLLEIVGFLKADPALSYDMLADISCVDYLGYPAPTAADHGRFGLVYIFNSVKAGTGGSPRLILRVFLNEPAIEVDSLVPLFAGAEWLEREVFDMFGIRFRNHPDLRRILTWDTFEPNPLRKDYPVTGKGERENYPIINRESA